MAKVPGAPGPRDRSRNNVGEESEVEYWAKALGVSKAKLIEVVKKVGDSLQAIRTEVTSDKR